MLGQTVTALKQPRLGAIFIAVGGLALLGIGFAASLLPLAGIGAIFCALGAGWWLAPQTRFAATFTEAGIQIDSHHQFLDYQDIVAVVGMPPPNKHAKGEHYPLDICTEEIGQSWPSRLSVPSGAVEDFLLSNMTANSSMPEDDDLAQFYREQTGRFGALAVSVFQSRIATRPLQRPWGFCGAFSGMVVASIAVIIWGSSLRKEPIMMTGIVCLIVGSIVMLLFFMLIHYRGGVKLKQRDLTCLVVSPFGIGLRQGGLKGILRWDELKNLGLRKVNSAFQASSAASTARVLDLKLDGTIIPLLDVYDRSLEKIEILLSHNWQESYRFVGR